MKIAVLADIHSNIFALKAVLQDMEREQTEGILILGDLFGYYPWAAETYETVSRIPDLVLIKGNHDLLIVQDAAPPEPVPFYYPAILQNRGELLQSHPESIPWLKGLPASRRLSLPGCELLLCHGTPDDPYWGRYYPNNKDEYDWFPKNGEVVMLGQTHYPLSRRVASGGMILNPGSVGQPRDGNPMPAWGIFDTETHDLEQRHSSYDNHEVMNLLKNKAWDARSIAALDKVKPGKL